jgi:hypothetical protein
MSRARGQSDSQKWTCRVKIVDVGAISSQAISFKYRSLATMNPESGRGQAARMRPVGAQHDGARASSQELHEFTIDAAD